MKQMNIQENLSCSRHFELPRISIYEFLLFFLDNYVLIYIPYYLSNVILTTFF